MFAWIQFIYAKVFAEVYARRLLVISITISLFSCFVFNNVIFSARIVLEMCDEQLLVLLPGGRNDSEGGQIVFGGADGRVGRSPDGRIVQQAFFLMSSLVLRYSSPKLLSYYLYRNSMWLCIISRFVLVQNISLCIHENSKKWDVCWAASFNVFPVCLWVQFIKSFNLPACSY